MKANRSRRRRLFMIANEVVAIITLFFFSTSTLFALPAGQQVSEPLEQAAAEFVVKTHPDGPGPAGGFGQGGLEPGMAMAEQGRSVGREKIHVLSPGGVGDKPALPGGKRQTAASV